MHIHLGLSVGSLVTRRTCGLMLHLEVCLMPDNYSQEGDSYPLPRWARRNESFQQLQKRSYHKSSPFRHQRGLLQHYWEVTSCNFWRYTTTSLSKYPNVVLTEWRTALFEESRWGGRNTMEKAWIPEGDWPGFQS